MHVRTPSTPHAADHLLSQCEAFIGVNWSLGRSEAISCSKSERIACAHCETTANDQWDSATSANLVKNNVTLQFKFGNSNALFVCDNALVGFDVAACLYSFV